MKAAMCRTCGTLTLRRDWHGKLECARCHQVTTLVMTSVTDAKSSLEHVSNLIILRAALALEQRARGGGRASLVQAFERRIRKLEKAQQLTT